MLGRTHLLVGLTTLGMVEQGVRWLIPPVSQRLIALEIVTAELVETLPAGLIQPHLVQGLPTGLALCATAVMLGALAPDLDAEQSEIKRTLGLAGAVSGLLLTLFGVSHRGLTHYGITALLILILSGLLGWRLGYADVGLAFGLGYLSHLLADALTVSGVPLWWPRPGLVHLLPRPLRLRTGGPVEQLLFVGLGLLVIGLLMSLLPPALRQTLGRWLL